MKKVELLSPAGDMASLIAAIQGGCNAVYISGRAFGARSFASNFSLAELNQAVIYAHNHLVKIYVTVNTIVFDDEFKELDEYLSYLENIKVDAVIVQDLGVIRLIKIKHPNLIVHASTQMNIFSWEAVDNLKKMGVERVVVAREIDLEEIKKIVDTGLEVEVFVHGALCYSLSGNCYLSSSIGTRSGNRGKCAQPCRKKYRILEDNIEITSNEAFLSMKDLMTLESINKLIDCGITSFKIEGRMKKSEYVYTVTKAYRKAIDEYLTKKTFNIDSQTLNDIKVTFNRGFTKGYILSDDNCNLTTITHVNHQGIKIGKVIECFNKQLRVKLYDSLHLHDGLRILDGTDKGIFLTSLKINNKNVTSAVSGDIVDINCDYKVKKGIEVAKTFDYALANSIENKLRTENIKTPINMTLYAYVGKELMLTAKTLVNEKLSVYGDIVKQSEQEINVARIKDQLSKLSSTPFIINNIEVKTSNYVYVPIKELNSLRRKLIEKLLKIRENITHNAAPYLLNTREQKIKQDIVIECVTSNELQTNVCQKFGVIAYEKEKGYAGRLNCSDAIMIHNLSQLKTPSQVLSPYFNVVNNESLTLLEELGAKQVYLSLELDKDRISKLNIKEHNLSIGMLVYGASDVMVSKHCVIGKIKKATNKNCGACQNHNYKLVDEYNDVFPLIFEKNNQCMLRISDRNKLNLINHIKYLKEIGITRFLLIFTDESSMQVETILKQFIDAIKNNNEYLVKNPYLGHFNNKIE